MVFDLVYEICVTNDPEIKTPSIVHASLPEAEGFVVLFRVEGGVVQVLDQLAATVCRMPTGRFRRFGIAPQEMFREAEDQLAGRLFFFLRSLAAPKPRPPEGGRRDDNRLLVFDSNGHISTDMCER
jgi:hypothetical protein